MKKRSVKANKMPSSKQIQDREMQRNGYTRKSGGTAREQASELNRVAAKT